MELSSQKALSFSQLLAHFILKVLAWRVDAMLPDCPKYVLIGAPHTSNMDFFYMLLLKYATGLKLHWIGKHTLFNKPFGGLMRKLGGIAVDRRSQNKFVEKIIEEINRHNEYVVAIAPEGTRSKSPYWRTGFYYIAQGAGIPIAFGYIDYREKVVGIGPSFVPSGDIQEDFNLIRSFYAGKTGRYPHLQGPMRLMTKENHGMK